MKIKEKRNNESEKNKNEINVKKNATNDGDDEIIKNDCYFENSYRS